jgi:Uma2 family endonuclease
MSSTALTTPGTVEDEQCLVLVSIPWRQYEAVLQAFPEQPGLRITYIDGRLTLLSPTHRHDWHEKAMCHLVIAIANALGIEWEAAGHTTYRLEGLAAGVEGDDTFYFGANAERMRGVQEIDLTTQPPPDLAIEVEVTHPADSAVAAWGRIGVPEVWRLDVDRRTLTFGLRRADGTYPPSPRSAAFPELEPNDVLAQLQMALQIGSSRWFAQLDGWVRNVLLPRRGA